MNKFGIAALFLVASVFLTGCFRPGNETQILRESILKASPDQWDEKFEFGVGRLTLALGKLGLRFLDINPDAKTALSSLRGADISIYKLAHANKSSRGSIMAAADLAMKEEGWDRLVGVRRDGQMVGVYVPRKMDSPRNVKVCLFVLSGQDFVCASAASDLEPLLALAMNHGELLRETQAFTKL